MVVGHFIKNQYYFGGMIVDHFIFGLNIKRRVCILSPKVDEITQFIVYDLHSGATLGEVIGAYENVVRREIVTIVDKQEYKQLMDYVRKVDPKAFVTVYSVNEICYQPKNDMQMKRESPGKVALILIVILSL